MKKQIRLFFLAILASGVSHAQSATDPVANSKRFFVNCVRHCRVDDSKILSAFKKNGNTQIFFYNTHQSPDLADLLFFTDKRDKQFAQTEDGVIPVAAGFPAKMNVQELADSNALTNAQHYDIKVAVSDVMQDSENTYVSFRFKSIGDLAAFYTGYLLCKYDSKGRLVKYSLIEE